MPASCLRDVELEEAINGLTNPDILDFTMSQQMAKELGIDGRAIANYDADTASSIKQIYDLLSGEATNSMLEVVSPEALSAARRVTLIDEQTARAGAKQTKAEYDETVSSILNSNRSLHYGMFQRAAAFLADKFVRATGTVESWALNNFGTEGRNAGSNPIVAALRKVSGTYSGTKNILYQEHIAPILNELKPIAERLGLPDTESLAQLVGTYQQMRGMRERNDLVDSNLVQAIKQQMSRKNPNLKLIKEYTNKLQQLREHRKDESGRIEGTRSARWHTGGYTDVEADNWIAKFHQDYDVAPETMQYFGDRLTEAYMKIQDFRARNGFETPENARALEGKAYYLPLKTTRDNSTGIANDATIYNPGNLHAALGTSDPNIADGYTTLMSFLNRTALENASKDLGYAFLGIHQAETARGLKPGEGSIFIEDYDAVQLRAHTGDVRALQTLDGNMGFAMTVLLPNINNKGSGTLERKLISFNPQYVDNVTGITGLQLANSFKQHESHALFRGMASANATMASLNTHWNVGFAPINFIKDGLERVSSMLGQTYKLESGTLVEGSNFVRSFVASIPTVSKFLFNLMRGKVDLNASDIGRYYQEYVQLGVKQEFDPTQLKNKKSGNIFTADDPNNIPEIRDPKLTSFWKQVINLGQDKLKPVAQTIHHWNEYFNNLSPFAQYYTLRKHGVQANSAREGATEVLNFREAGEYTDALRAFYAFAKPTMQGGASALRSLGLAPNASGQFRLNMKGLAYLLGTTFTYAITKAAAAGAMGEDEYDKLSFDDKTRFIPIPLNDGVLKIPVPFGTAPVGFAIGAATDMIYRGKMSAEEGTARILMSVLKAVQPAELPDFSMREHPTEWFMHALSPAFLKPIVTTSSNLNYQGGTISYANENGLEPKAMQGRATTSTGYHTAAKLLHGTLGIDLAPEQVKALCDGYFTGPLRILNSVINEQSLYHMGYDKTTQGILGPWYSALGLSMGWKKLSEGHSSLFYETYDKAKADIRKLGIKLTNPEAYKGDSEARYAYIRKTLEDANYNDEKIERFILLDRADKEKRKISKLFKQKLFAEDNMLDAAQSYAAAQALYDEYHEQCEEIYKQGLGL